MTLLFIIFGIICLLIAFRDPIKKVVKYNAKTLSTEKGICNRIIMVTAVCILSFLFFMGGFVIIVVYVLMP